jgi:hypothetical protein
MPRDTKVDHQSVTVTGAWARGENVDRDDRILRGPPHRDPTHRCSTWAGRFRPVQKHSMLDFSSSSDLAPHTA